MAWTEQDLREIEDELKKDSQGVGDVPEAESLDGITSLPAYQEKDGEEIIVRAPLELLAAPALEAADKANEAADKAESNATAAQTAANTANEKAELAAQAASDANAAKEEAEAATQSANNAASNAEEKAAAANTAAQDAEKVANNPTYIGTDHYVYVYNKETDSFDKTGIYCKGEPGSSFRIAGEYATLEALKSAVPDGSAVDGFMAVGTEAPYDYYAWVNGDWVNQGKIAGGGSGNVVVIPSAAMSLSDQATSDEIFNAFGGKDAFMDICQSIVNKDTVCVVANIPEEPGMKLVYIPIMAMATYTDANNANFMMAIITETTFQLVVTVTDGVATQSSQVLNHIYEAPSDGNVYGRKNKDWVEVPEHLNLTSEDLNDINGAGFATQKSIAGYTTPENNYPINENGALIFANAHYSRSNQIYGSYLTNRWFARGGGNQQGIRTDWKEFVFTGDVLTKTNTSSFTPTEPYHPATKKYVDDKIFARDVDGTIINKWINNTVITGETVQDLADELFGNFRSFVEGYSDGKYTDLRFSIRHFDDTTGAWFGYIINANIQYCLAEAGNGYYALLFTFGYMTSLKYCYIYYYDVSETSNNNKIVITDVITSDNLTTITKKTAAEYEALGSKDANTAYCVTD
jgi:hypothetical protein|nr:MAG TPA: Fibritin C-terminal region [Caudoviricetes sp.]